MDKIISKVSDDLEMVTKDDDYYTDVVELFSSVPEIARPLIRNAKVALSKIKDMLCSTPAFINLLKTSIPEETFIAVLTNEQKSKIANGALKLMTKGCS